MTPLVSFERMDNFGSILVREEDRSKKGALDRLIGRLCGPADTFVRGDLGEISRSGCTRVRSRHRQIGQVCSAGSSTGYLERPADKRWPLPCEGDIITGGFLSNAVESPWMSSADDGNWLPISLSLIVTIPLTLNTRCSPKSSFIANIRQNKAKMVRNKQAS
ncbi:hypothetical protein L209DRAFT_445464 [Thermothelomyces heterothallicus CBS 203.75]